MVGKLIDNSIFWSSIATPKSRSRRYFSISRLMKSALSGLFSKRGHERIVAFSKGQSISSVTDDKGTYEMIAGKRSRSVLRAPDQSCLTIDRVDNKLTRTGRRNAAGHAFANGKFLKLQHLFDKLRSCAQPHPLRVGDRPSASGKSPSTTMPRIRLYAPFSNILEA